MIPSDFPHQAPKGMYYDSVQFKRNVVAIWIHYKRKFDYNNGDHVRCIWGFYDTKTRTYYAPINSSKQGSKVDVNSTTPYTAMPINLSPLELAFL